MSVEDDTDASSELETSEEEEDEEEDDEEEEVQQLQLPNRATRGKRLNKLLEEEDSADEEFWNQDFFQEDNKDEEYEEETSEASSADTDFEEAESTSDEEGEEVQERTKRKTLKPPGAKKPLRKPAGLPAVATRSPPPGLAGPASPGSPMSPATRAAVRQATLDSIAEANQFQAPTLRKSTRARVEEAEKERQLAEQKKPRKAQQKQEFRPLTQEELLAEAAQTELENTASVQALIAAEEEVKARAAARKAKYSGPLLRYHSFKSGEESVMLFEIANMLPPKEMQPQKAPPPPPKPICVVTGQPAKYRDPETGMPYADLEAFREMRRRCADGKPLHYKRTKRRRLGTGGWAQVATALLEDSPTASTWQGMPQSQPSMAVQPGAPARAGPTVPLQPSQGPMLQAAGPAAPVQAPLGSPAASVGLLRAPAVSFLPAPVSAVPPPNGGFAQSAASKALPTMVSFHGAGSGVKGESGGLSDADAATPSGAVMPHGGGGPPPASSYAKGDCTSWAGSGQAECASDSPVEKPRESHSMSGGAPTNMVTPAVAHDLLGASREHPP